VDLEQRARSLLSEDGVGAQRMVLSRTAQMRYVGQTYEVETPIPPERITPGHVPRIVQDFHRHHKLEYGVSSDEFAPAFVSLAVTGSGAWPRPRPSGTEVATLPTTHGREIAVSISPVNGSAARSMMGNDWRWGRRYAGTGNRRVRARVCDSTAGTRGRVDVFSNLVIDVGA